MFRVYHGLCRAFAWQCYTGSMTTLREALVSAQSEKRALGHFNVGNMEMLRAVVAAAQETTMPVIIGVSEGERDVFGVRGIVALVRALKEDISVPIFLNADHTYSVERVKEAIDAGFDSVIFDGAKLSFDENVEKTKECVTYARASGRDVVVEGELGFIGSGSKFLETVPEGAATTEDMMTSPEDAARFVAATGADALAPAVGNIHGLIRSGNPRLSASRVEALRNAVDTPLVLHGGSGISDDDFRAVIAAGISLIHVSTELRVAYRQALMQSLANEPDELAPYKYAKGAVTAVQNVITERLHLFSNTA